MAEIKCPNCGTVFTVDESGYAQIVAQVRDAEFERELKRRMDLLQSNNAQATQLEVAKVRDDLQRQAVREREASQRELAERDARIAELVAKVDALSMGREQAVRLAQTEAQQKAQGDLAARQAEIAQLKAQVTTLEQAYRQQAQTQERTFEAQLALAKSEAERRAGDLQTQMTAQLAAKDVQIKDAQDEIERLRDLRSRQSTKLVGESLEQHCLIEFNKIRATAFPHAYFEKDNDASEGTKGDFIYREKLDGVIDDDGPDLLSIMFEMKNEADASDPRNQKTNEHFFAKLDADRKKKKCEYAVLVSLLEPESELYNTGIVDVSYRYPKMYVIRPQFFIPIITVLRNAALNAADARRELDEARKQNIDITNFEEKMEAFKDGFSKNFQSASKRFDTAIDEIDKTIAHLQKVKDNLTASQNQLRLANDKAQQQLTIRRLTWNNPTMKARFAELDAGEKDGQ
ncbi:MAG: DUF2130 domain-containing protein [Olegusella sp.]|nr:DUF2130 domain-containing protein [Olegusella sp.]